MRPFWRASTRLLEGLHKGSLRVLELLYKGSKRALEGFFKYGLRFRHRRVGF